MVRLLNRSNIRKFVRVDRSFIAYKSFNFSFFLVKFVGNNFFFKRNFCKNFYTKKNEALQYLGGLVTSLKTNTIFLRHINTFVRLKKRIYARKMLPLSVLRIENHRFKGGLNFVSRYLKVLFFILLKIKFYKTYIRNVSRLSSYSSNLI